MTMDRQTPPEAVTPSVRRPWLAPAIALGLALLLVLILLIPGVLRYRSGADAATLAALRDSNAALEQEIARLGRADPAQICMYQGDLFPRSVEESQTPPTPAQRLDLLPPLPSQSLPAPEALPENAAIDAANVDDLLRRGTVLVLAQTPEGMTNGSGFFIDSRHVVTNAHVIEDATAVTVTNDTIQQPLAATVIARSDSDGSGDMPQEDFAVLRLEADVASAVPLTLGQPRRMQVVYASGYPGFYLENQIRSYFQNRMSGQNAIPPEAVVTDGMVTTIQTVARPGGPLGYLPHTAKLSPGNSGGPLVDICGRVVGINTFVTQSSEDDLLLHGDYALSADGLAAFLQANEIRYRRAEGDCTPTRAPAAPQNGETPDQSPEQNPEAAPQ